MRLFVRIIIFIILLPSAHAQDFEDSLEYRFEQKPFSLNLTDISNSSPIYISHNQEKSRELTSEISSRFSQDPMVYSTNSTANTNYSDFYRIRKAHTALISRPINSNSSLFKIESSSIMEQVKTSKIPSRFFDSKRIHYDNPPVNITHADFHAIRQVDNNLKPENRLNILKLSENVKISIYDEHTFELEKPDLNSAHLTENDLAEDPILKSLASELDKIKSFPDSTQGNKSRIVVNTGDSIQAAIDNLAPGGIIEINSGIYNESVRIDKPLTIMGVDVGRGLPVIDASRRGNTVEVSADQVILEGIITTNSSNDINRPGAGIQFSSSNNSYLEDIVSYNNYRGIELVDSNNNIISGSSISNNSYCGIELAESNNNTISKSNISNSDLGVRFFDSAGNTLEWSYVKNTATSLEFVSSSYNSIRNNTFQDNNVVLSEGNEFSNNTVINITKMDPDDNVKGVKTDAPPTESSTKSKQPSRGGWIPMPIYGDVYQDFAEEAAGTLVFNPPAVMINGTGEWIDARIGLENTSNLVEGLLGKGEVRFRHINAKTNLTYIVKLESDNGFEILSKRPEAQVLGEDPAVWLWYITPQQAGNHTLILTVDLQLNEPPYNCKCVNVTHWPVQVKVVEQSSQQRLWGAADSAYSSTKAIITFLTSIFSLVVLYQQLRKRNERKNNS